MAVLDSKFRVRGVKGLRVVDASAFPEVPGAFPVLPTYMISAKAAEDIIATAKGEGSTAKDDCANMSSSCRPDTKGSGGKHT